VGRRTGCGTIFNDSQDPFEVYDPMSQSGRGIPPGDNRTFGCRPAFAWCSNDNEIRLSAFRFRSMPQGVPGGRDEFYVFEDGRTTDGRLEWTPMAGAATSYATRRSAGVAGAGCVNIRISANKEPRAEIVW